MRPDQSPKSASPASRTTPDAPLTLPAKRRLARVAREFKVVCLRECHLEDDAAICDTPADAAAYWRGNIASDPRFNAEVESLYVLILNTRRRPTGHYLVSQGLFDTVLFHPRELFRCAVVAGAAGIVVFHNHPSGDPSPSANDVRVTRSIIHAGEIMDIKVHDHLVMGRSAPGRPKDYASLRELGYFYDLKTPPPAENNANRRAESRRKNGLPRGRHTSAHRSIKTAAIAAGN